jgi:hypothetical protein
MIFEHAQEFALCLLTLKYFRNKKTSNFEMKFFYSQAKENNMKKIMRLSRFEIAVKLLNHDLKQLLTCPLHLLGNHCGALSAIWLGETFPS